MRALLRRGNFRLGWNMEDILFHEIETVDKETPLTKESAEILDLDDPQIGNRLNRIIDESGLD